ncbi:MAG: hypothetical protein JST80_09920 [Bdellovibrionales bacterium]|nr:hypothetical protein [Bdellovibrionales bacterium]
MKRTYLNAVIFAAMMALVSSTGFARADDALPAAPAASTDATAGKGTGAHIEKRIDKQHKRIQKLEEKGKITADQASDLNKQVDAVATKEQSEKANGLNKSERKELNQELNASSKAIKAAKKKK